MPIRVVLLGTGGSDPPVGRAGPSLLLDTGSNILLVDCGEMCLERLRMAGYTPCEVDMVIVTHAHFDHVAGLFSLSVARSVEGCRRLVIVSDEVVVEQLKGMLRFPSSVETVYRGVREIEAPGCKVRLTPVDHTIEAFGVVIEEDGTPTVFYTGDTRLSNRLLETAPRGVKLLVAEATLPDSLENVARETGHMTVSQVLRLRELLEASFVAPFHLTPQSLRQLQSHRRLPPGVILASDGTSIVV